MTESRLVQEVLARGFDSIENLGNHVFRGERLYAGKPFAVAYIDLSDDIVERSSTLASFQERFLGPKYFDVEGDLRWNSYLYLWAGPRSLSHEAFAKAKARIERERHYARKFVVTQKELAKRLEPLVLAQPETGSKEDASATWSDMLRSASLAILLEQRPRVRALELIASGEAFVADTHTVASTPEARQDPLQTGRLRSLSIATFRPINAGRDFHFGDVTLIFGPNGSGKTSLLEAVEALYCGRIRRDPDADFSGITGEVLTATDTLVPVQCTTHVATLKARNVSWYGRSDQHSHALLQGFSRFNFLDTDAAFRLSATTDTDQIQLDLSRLLVGPEAGKLWIYLSKLAEESLGKQKELDGHASVLRARVELLAAELARLRTVPTEARTLAQTYFSRLVDLGAKWHTPDRPLAIPPNDRDRLDSLCRAIDQALSVVRSTPLTLLVLREHSHALEQALNQARSVSETYSHSAQQLDECQRHARKSQSDAESVELWARFCEAGAPRIATELTRVTLDLATVRSRLRGHTLEGTLDLPAEYDSETLSQALALAVSTLHRSEQQEQVALAHLQQNEQLSTTVATLRKDLHDIAQTLIQHTGDSLHCPLCTTQHTSADLLEKLERLVGSDTTPGTESLRIAVRAARDLVERDRRVVSALKSLEEYRSTAGAAMTLTAAEIREDLRLFHARLTALNEDSQRLQSAISALATFGVDWRHYEPARLAAATILGEEGLDDPAVVRGSLTSIQSSWKEAQDKGSALRQLLADATARALALAQAAGLNPGTGYGPSDVVTSLERVSVQAVRAVEHIELASQDVVIAEGQALEPLRLALTDAIRLLDQALHAEQTESQSRIDLQRKTGELEATQRELLATMKVHGNYGRALEVLSDIVHNHSLDKATKDALDVIRQRVSDVFARIHAPSEYALGSLDGEELLIALDTGQPRRASQVSTGQRSALALSIFLALNGSASSAPPVLLIDDPVAHIDDLNALSFLDYLRDLVLSTNRQVFFSTADARLAALFERKFEFLGSERFRKILLAR